ncbi:MAG: hypothetical protein MI741_23540, partial [Rhodospirillales bacterium]|nr:hypothetical protein [Rhodospirillales bacterium]
GVKLLNLFRMGENGIAEIQARMEKWGATFDRIDAAKVERANDAIANAQATARVFGNTMAIEVAPIIEVSANKFTKWADEGVISAVKIQEGVRSVALNVAALTDRIDVVSGAWVELRRIGQEWFRDTIQTILLARQGFNHLKAGALDVQATLLSLSPVGSGDRVKHLRDMEQAANDGAKALHSLRTAMVRGANVEIDALKDRYLRLRIGPSWQQQTEKFFEDLDKATAKARENLEAMNGGGTGNIDIEGMVERMNEQAAAAQKVNDMLADIDRQIRTFGMSDMEMKLFDLKSIGATVEQIENARSKLMDLDRLQEQADRRARQEERASEIASIIRRLEDDARRIGLSERDKLALDLEALGAGDDKIIKALQLFDEAERRRKALKDPNDTSLSESPVLRLVRAGSAEADRLRFQSQNQQREKIPQQQLAEQKRTNKKLNRLDRIERAVEKLGEGQGWDID